MDNRKSIGAITVIRNKEGKTFIRGNESMRAVIDEIVEAEINRQREQERKEYEQQIAQMEYQKRIANRKYIVQKERVKQLSEQRDKYLEERLCELHERINPKGCKRVIRDIEKCCVMAIFGIIFTGEKIIGIVRKN